MWALDNRTSHRRLGDHIQRCSIVRNVVFFERHLIVQPVLCAIEIVRNHSAIRLSQKADVGPSERLFRLATSFLGAVAQPVAWVGIGLVIDGHLASALGKRLKTRQCHYKL